jgi:pimeloyl-ACP methyl ester carboxylesterase
MNTLQLQQNKKRILFFLIVLIVTIVHQSCFMNRMNDKKVKRIFAAKKVDISIKDFYTKDSFKVHYAVSGQDKRKPLLVFIHGSPGSWMNYMKYMWDTALTAKYNIICIDRPGFGYSEFGNTKDIFMQADYLLQLLHQENLGTPIVLVGHSMGGPVISAMAQQERLFIHTIVLVAASIDLKQEHKERWRTIMRPAPLCYLLPGAFRPSNDELLQLKKDLILLDKNFGKISCNVLYIHAIGDNMVPIENVAFAKANITNAASQDSLIFGKKDGHFIPWQRKQEITNKLLQIKL